MDMFQDCKDTLGFNLAAMGHLKVCIHTLYYIEMIMIARLRVPTILLY